MFYDSLNGCEDSTNKFLAISEISDTNMGSSQFVLCTNVFQNINKHGAWIVGGPTGEQSTLLGRTVQYAFLLFLNAVATGK